MNESQSVRRSDDDELNEIIDSSSPESYYEAYDDECYSPVDEDEDNEMKAGSICQWQTDDDAKYMPSGKTERELPPGMYNIIDDPRVGIYFEKVPVKTQGLLKLSGSESSEVSDEIASFWEKEDIYRKHNFSYKRGILLWGPPGTGKSSTIQIVVEDVIKRGGVCISFDDPYAFRKGMRMFRQIQKETPVVVVMEDIDSLIYDFSESEILNILDGIENVDKMVFLSTTNYPEKLGHRICNRPSRFDRRFKIDFPSKEDRKLYIESLNRDNLLDAAKISKWAKDTDGLAFAHIKELFVSVTILGNPYAKALAGLKKMKNNPAKESKRSAGFSTDE